VLFIAGSACFLIAPMVLTFEPRRIVWWSAGVQLLGTLFFNATTFWALQTGIESPGYDRLVWRPDALGSICFLVSGYLAFEVSAVASYIVPTTGDERNLAVVNTFTALGALCFLIGAVLLLPEGARASATEA
jgi:hypothetical protein